MTQSNNEVNCCDMDLEIRKGCKDVWNSFMVNGAKFSDYSDIPICDSSNIILPKNLIAFNDAKTLHNTKIKRGNLDYLEDSFIHFYIDDYKFDGKKSSIWLYPEKALNIIKHFSGIITPDFSTYADFPDPIKRFNTYRMRAFGCWISKHGIPVINNVRWGTPETFSYCFDGITSESIISVGAVASGLKNSVNREMFIIGFKKMIEILHPKVILIYGSHQFSYINELKQNGITILQFQSKTSEIFNRRKHNEQNK